MFSNFSQLTATLTNASTTKVIVAAQSGEDDDSTTGIAILDSGSIVIGTYVLLLLVVILLFLCCLVIVCLLCKLQSQKNDNSMTKTAIDNVIRQASSSHTVTGGAPIANANSHPNIAQHGTLQEENNNGNTDNSGDDEIIYTSVALSHETGIVTPQTQTYDQYHDEYNPNSGDFIPSNKNNINNNSPDANGNIANSQFARLKKQRQKKSHGNGNINNNTNNNKLSNKKLSFGDENMQVIDSNDLSVATTLPLPHIADNRNHKNSNENQAMQMARMGHQYYDDNYKVPDTPSSVFQSASHGTYCGYPYSSLNYRQRALAAQAAVGMGVGIGAQGLGIPMGYPLAWQQQLQARNQLTLPYGPVSMCQNNNINENENDNDRNRNISITIPNDDLLENLNPIGVIPTENGMIFIVTPNNERTSQSDRDSSTMTSSMNRLQVQQQLRNQSLSDVQGHNDNHKSNCMNSNINSEHISDPDPRSRQLQMQTSQLHQLQQFQTVQTVQTVQTLPMISMPNTSELQQQQQGKTNYLDVNAASPSDESSLTQMHLSPTMMPTVNHVQFCDHLVLEESAHQQQKQQQQQKQVRESPKTASKLKKSMVYDVKDSNKKHKQQQIRSGVRTRNDDNDGNDGDDEPDKKRSILPRRYKNRGQVKQSEQIKYNINIDDVLYDEEKDNNGINNNNNNNNTGGNMNRNRALSSASNMAVGYQTDRDVVDQDNDDGIHEGDARMLALAKLSVFSSHDNGQSGDFEKCSYESYDNTGKGAGDRTQTSTVTCTATTIATEMTRITKSGIINDETIGFDVSASCTPPPAGILALQNRTSSSRMHDKWYYTSINKVRSGGHNNTSYKYNIGKHPSTSSQQSHTNTAEAQKYQTAKMLRSIKEEYTIKLDLGNGLGKGSIVIPYSPQLSDVENIIDADDIEPDDIN